MFLSVLSGAPRFLHATYNLALSMLHLHQPLLHPLGLMYMVQHSVCIAQGQSNMWC